MKYEEMNTKELKQKLAYFKTVLKYEPSIWTLEEINKIDKILKERRKILKK